MVQLIFLAFPAYLALQCYTLIRWRRGWRIAAAFPLLLMVPVIVITINAFVHESNVWPILLLVGSPVGLAILIILSIARVLTHR